jgi:hypothetical protein
MTKPGAEQIRTDRRPKPVPGGWYLGVPCSQCDDIVIFAPGDRASGLDQPPPATAAQAR